MNTTEIIARYYTDNPALCEILLHHSRQVCNHALAVAERHPELNLDTKLLADGAMLHDLGIVQCDAPAIHCHGTEPYIAHGRLGAAMLRQLQQELMAAGSDIDLEPLARICERHTGTGLPGFEPESLEEQVVCYADKFYSKTHLERTRTPEQTAESLKKFGEEGVRRFWEWHQRFA